MAGAVWTKGQTPPLSSSSSIHPCRQQHKTEEKKKEKNGKHKYSTRYVLLFCHCYFLFCCAAGDLAPSNTLSLDHDETVCADGPGSVYFWDKRQQLTRKSLSPFPGFSVRVFFGLIPTHKKKWVYHPKVCVFFGPWLHRVKRYPP